MTKIRRVARLRDAGMRGLTAAVLAGSAMLGLCQGAQAQFAFEDDVLPPRVVAWRLADRGFSGLSRPRFNGRVYVVEAVSPSGAPVRLFVDPSAGAIVGQQRLGAPETYARLERPAPGFGWTEDDAAPRRVLRPSPADDGPALRLPRRSDGAALRPEGVPDGVNPDGTARPAPQRRLARVAPSRQPDLKATHRDAPEAPKIGSLSKVAPVETAKVEPGHDAKSDGKAETGLATRSAAIDKAPSAGPSPAGAAPTPTDGTVAAAAKPPGQDWKDPPTDRKPVRVIGGATIVPGTSEKDPASAQ
jgi:hypothetical protein